MKASTYTRFGVLVAMLSVFAGASAAVATASPVWLNKHGLQVTISSFYSPVETAQFEAYGPGGGLEFWLGCHMKTEGVLEWGGHGVIASVTDSNGNAKMACFEEAMGGNEQCAPPETVEAQNLPWATELVYGTGSEVRDLIKPGSNGGTPGWKITCHQNYVGTLVEKCPFGGYSRFSKNGELGAELLYEPEFAKGEMCESNDGYFEGNTLKLKYLEVTPGYTIGS